jgi:hypothetical protein
MGKRWCNVCKFMAYDGCHEEPSRTVPNDIKLTGPSALVILPFPETIVAGLTYASIPAYPQIPGKPLHLAVPPEIAPFFMIEDIKIGKNSQFAAPSGIRASCFPPLPKDPPWWNNLYGIEPWMIGHIVTLQVRNLDAACHPFSAVMRAQGFREEPWKMTYKM